MSDKTVISEKQVLVVKNTYLNKNLAKYRLIANIKYGK